MYLDKQKIQTIAQRNGLSISAMLRKAGVSRTAFYSLFRGQSLLPDSVHSIAGALDVSPVELLSVESEDVRRIKQIEQEAERICQMYPDASRDHVRHTLLLLSEPPVQRLERALRRGRNLYR